MNALIFVTLLFGAAFAADKDAPIENQVQDVGLEGNFQNSWSGNGISVQEVGSSKSVARGKVVGDDIAQVIQGTASWTDPAGGTHQISWNADENGAVYQGADIPTPPPAEPIPEYIARALAWAEAHPYNEEAILKKTY